MNILMSKIIPFIFMILIIVATLISKKYICNDEDIFKDSPIVEGKILSSTRVGSRFQYLINFTDVHGNNYVGRTEDLKKSSLKNGSIVQIKYSIDESKKSLLGIQPNQLVKIVNNDNVIYCRKNIKLRKMLINCLLIIFVVLAIYILICF